MNKSNLFRLLLFALFTMHHGYAFQITERTCEEKIAIAKIYFKFVDDLDVKLKDQILESLSSCNDPLDIELKYMKGLLTMDSEKPENTDFDGFTLIDQAANQGSINAARRLGLLWKIGRGIDWLGNTGVTDYQMSHYWYNRIQSVDSVGKFAVGYYKMKALNGVANYAQAINYFNESSYPMAKHWLAICYYFGFGVEIDKNKAIDILQQNDIPNSKVLLEHLLSTVPKDDPILTSQELEAINQSGHTPFGFNLWVTPNIPLVGKLIEYDWEKQRIRRTLPITLTLKKTYSGTAGVLIEGENGLYAEDTLYHRSGQNRVHGGEINVPVKALYPSHPENENITIQFEEIKLWKKNASEVPYILATTKSTVTDWNEKTTNFIFLLQEESDVSRLDPISPVKYDDNFATVYPNPVSNQFTLTYTLKKAATVRVEVYDLYANQRIDVAKEQYQQEGDQNYKINSSSLSSGVYVVRITINGEIYNKTIVKI
ncbi:T9SS type A sorting domain-containing protein [Aquimarina sp. 2304DJ70-9]|uniref:T9SS type A sorting domain-containing protein n=1 Tax=Aquimarina penaris TaxID=3231044 RepID=UPI00346347FF